MRSTARVARSAVATIKSGLTSTTDAESFKRLIAEQRIAVWKLGSPDEQQHWRGPLLLKIIAARRAGRNVALPAGLTDDTPTAPPMKPISRRCNFRLQHNPRSPIRLTDCLSPINLLHESTESSLDTFRYTAVESSFQLDR